MYYNSQKGNEPKEVKRNSERKMGIMKIVGSFCQMLKTASEINHNSGMKKTANFTNWLEGTADGFTDLAFSEDNYQAYDKLEREEEERRLEKESMKTEN